MVQDVLQVPSIWIVPYASDDAVMAKMQEERIVCPFCIANGKGEFKLLSNGCHSTNYPGMDGRFSLCGGCTEATIELKMFYYHKCPNCSTVFLEPSWMAVYCHHYMLRWKPWHNRLLSWLKQSDCVFYRCSLCHYTYCKAHNETVYEGHS